MRRLSARGPGQTTSGRGFHFGVEVGDNVLESRDGLLDRRDLHQLPAADRAVAVLQRDNQIPPLLLELNKRQTVVWQMSHDMFPALVDDDIRSMADWLCNPLTKLR
jgi:hypothetical protein